MATSNRWWWCVPVLILGICGSIVLGQDPTFDATPCVEDINTQPDDGSNVATVYWAIPLANSGAAFVACDPAPGSEFPGGDNVVTCTATDTADQSRTAECTFKVRVYPTFVTGCQASIVQEDGTAGKVSITLPDVSLDSSGETPVASCDKTSTDAFNTDEETPVRCTARDTVLDQMVSCTFTVTIGTAPTFDTRGSCDTGPINVAPDAGGMTKTGGITWTRPTRTGGGNAECDPDPDADSFPGGETAVTCTIENPTAPSLINTCTFAVRVFPTFETGCPADIIVPPEGDGTTEVTITAPLGALDSQGDEPAAVTCGEDGATDFTDEAATPVTCTATDSDTTNFPTTATCTFTVTVGEAPTFGDEGSCVTGPINVVPDANAMTKTGLSTTEWTNPERADGVEATCEPDPDTFVFPGGETVVTCTIQHATLTSIKDTCTFTVRVFPQFEDNSCGVDIRRSPDPGDYQATVAWLNTPTAKTKDNDDATVTCDAASGDKFEKDENEVKCTATQGSGEESTCTFNIFLFPALSGAVDDIVRAPDAGLNTATGGWTDPTAVGSGGSTPVTCTPASDSPLSGGTTNVVCEAEDPLSSAFKATNSFTVSVFPTFETGCPANMVVPPAAAPATTTRVDFDIPAGAPDSDNVAAAVSCEPNTGADFNNDVAREVECTATDSVIGANTATCTFMVTVGVAPTFDDDPACDADFDVAPDSGKNMATNVVYPARTATDDESNPATVTCDPASNTDFEAGDTPVTCTAVKTGLETLLSTCRFNVRVYPTFSRGCPENPIIVAPNADGEAVVSWEDVTGNDDTTGEPAAVVCDPSSESTFTEAETTVKCTATDAGTTNTATCTFKVILDGEAPTVTCPADPPSIAMVSGTNTATASWTDPTVANDGDDPDRPVNVQCVPPSGTKFTYGTTEVVCWAVDAANNIGQCSFNVQVTGPDCDPACPTDTSTCTLPDDGVPVCICKTGYSSADGSGTDCANIDECAADVSPCHKDAVCSDETLPILFGCACKDGFYGDGIYSCEPYPSEYPPIDLPDLEKAFLVEIAIIGDLSTTSGCDPDDDKMSLACFMLINSFKKYITPLYETVSDSGFKSVIVNQMDIRKGSIVIPHTVTYSYTTEDVRSVGAEEFYDKSVKQAVQAGKIGSLQLATSANVSETTDLCTDAIKLAMTCPYEMVVKEDTTSGGGCVLVCQSPCKTDSKYCNDGTCSQSTGKDPVCSCPKDTEGDRCTPVGINIPLIVGLSVGLGGGALLIIIGILIYCLCKNKTKVSVNVDTEGNSREVLSMDTQKA